MAESTNPTVLGPDATLRGELTVSGSVRILGTIEGLIRAQGECIIGHSGQCQADVEGDAIVIEGVVKGNILARERLTLGSKASVEGDVQAASLIVAEGASFVGRVSVGPEAIAQTPRQVETKPSRTTKTTDKPGTKGVREAADWIPDAPAINSATPSNGDWLAQAGVTTAKPAWIKNGTEA